MSRALFALSLVGLLLSLAPGAARAQERRTRFDTPAYGTEWSTTPQYQPSPENWTVELRVGTYQPEVGPAFGAFRGDLGPMLGAEMDGHAFRVPYIGPIVFGVGFGWAEWNGPASSTLAGANVGDTGLSLVMFTGLAGWRIDGLARNLNIPLVLTPKIGVDFGYWQTGVTGRTQGDGWTIGLHWGAQIALELDFLDPRAAHRLDNAWGINHSEIFFEVYGADIGPFSDHMLPLGTGFTWAAGLGFTF
ncbi:MAG: MXAN_2562 family outer membrane beta-barrel protein [Sandaracinus sp.]